MIASSFLLVILATAFQQTAGQATRNPPCAGDADVVFLVDASSSTTANDLITSLKFIRGDNGFLRLMELDQTEYSHSQVGLVLNRDNGVVDIPLGNISDFTQLANAIQFVGQTAYVNRPGNLSAALRLAANQFLLANGGRSRSPHIIFMIVTDVLIARTSQSQLNSVASKVLSEGAIIMAAVYGSSQDPTLINGIVSGIVSYPPDSYKFYFLDARLNNSSGNSDLRSKSVSQLCAEIPICATIADIAFLLETSGNVWPGDWESMKLIVTTAVQSLNIGPNGAHVALMKFDATQKLIFDLGRYLNRYEMIQATNNVEYDEGHSINIAQSIKFASDQIFSDAGGWRPFATHILILITTGYSNVDSDLTRPYAQAIHDRGIYLFAIGVGPPNPTLIAELQELASTPPEEFYYAVSTFESLQQINTALIGRACKPKSAECNATLDIVFLIDTSSSIPDTGFQRVKRLIVDMSARLKIQEGLAQVAVVTFADAPYPQIYLNSFNTPTSLVDAVTAISYSDGKTNPGAAIKFVREVVFSRTNGARVGVTEVMILVTDGGADNKTIAAMEAKLTRDDGIKILAIGIGDSVETSELLTMATFPSDLNTLLIFNYDILLTVIDPLINLICQDTDNCASNPCKNNGVCKNGQNNFFCQGEGNFTGRTCEQTYTISLTSAFDMQHVSCIFDRATKLKDLIYLLCVDVYYSSEYPYRQTAWLMTYEDSPPHDLLMITALEKTIATADSVVGIEESNMLYVEDWLSGYIWKIDLNKNKIIKWMSNVRLCSRLSLTYDNKHLLLVRSKAGGVHLEIYDEDKKRLKRISLPISCYALRQAILKRNGEFIVTHVLDWYNVLASIVSSDGHIIDQFIVENTECMLLKFLLDAENNISNATQPFITHKYCLNNLIIKDARVTNYACYSRPSQLFYDRAKRQLVINYISNSYYIFTFSKI